MKHTLKRVQLTHDDVRSSHTRCSRRHCDSQNRYERLGNDGNSEAKAKLARETRDVDGHARNSVDGDLVVDMKLPRTLACVATDFKTTYLGDGKYDEK